MNQPLRKTRIALLATAAAVALAGAVVVMLAYNSEPVIRIAFNLTDQSGAVVTERDFEGRHLLVFFGFTNCPDICPTQMSKLTAAMQRLDESGHADEVTPMFVSVDPERDTPDEVQRYLARFDHRFVGLTGPRAALTDAAASFRTFLQTAPPPGMTDYQVVHATTVYMVDPKGRIVSFIAGGEDAEAIAAAVRSRLG